MEPITFNIGAYVLIPILAAVLGGDNMLQLFLRQNSGGLSFFSIEERMSHL